MLDFCFWSMVFLYICFMMTRFLSLFTALSLVTQSIAALPKFQFRDMTSQSGLSSYTVLAMTQDRMGMIWIGTADGLYSTDGIEMIRHDFCPVGDNLVINSLMTDSADRLWIGTDNAVHVYDSDIHFYFSSGVTSILEDMDSNIWIATRGDGVMRYHPPTGETDVFDGVGECEVLFLDSHNILWMCSREGIIHLYSFADDTLREANLSWESAVPARIMSIVEDGSSDLWLVSWNSGVFHLDRASMTATGMPVPLGAKGFSHVHHSMEYRPSELLVSSDDGLAWYNTQTGESGLVTSQRFVYPVIKDAEGGVWFGSYYGGVYYSSKNSGQFDAFALEIDGEDSIVSCLFEDSDGTVWAGSDNHGLINFSPKDGHIIRRYMPARNVHSIIQDGDCLWVGSYAGGVHKVDRKTGAVKDYLPGASAFALMIDSRDDMWVATMGSIIRFDRKSGTVLDTFECGDNIMDIAETSDGTLWFATNSKGLLRYDPSNGTWIELKRDSGLPSEHVNCLFVSEGKDIYVGTASGLSIVSTSGGVLMNQDFSIGKNILFVTSDGSSIWCTTTEGLFRFNRDDGTTERYIMDDGLNSLQFMSASGTSSANGRIFLGTSSGVNAFYPHSIHTNDYIPPVVITRFRMREKNHRASGQPIEYQVVEDYDNPVFKHNQNNFIFSFASLSYTSPAKNRYKYMLEGFDERWRESEGYRAEYTNIPAGKYVFRVKASNNDGVWNEEGASVRFTVKPHFLKSTGAMTLYLFASIFLISLIFSFIQKRVKEISDERYNIYVREFEENERARRDKDMVQKLKEIIKANISNSELTADYLANELCVSRSGLFSKVKEVTGKTPHDLIMEERLEQATALLETTDKSVSDISYLVGFNSPSYFSKCFTKAKGKSPYQWRS